MLVLQTHFYLLLRYSTEEVFNSLYGNICGPTVLHVTDKLVKSFCVSNTIAYFIIGSPTVWAFFEANLGSLPLIWLRPKWTHGSQFIV
jgi:hypothetical protein